VIIEIPLLDGAEEFWWDLLDSFGDAFLDVLGVIICNTIKLTRVFKVSVHVVIRDIHVLVASPMSLVSELWLMSHCLPDLGSYLESAGLHECSPNSLEPCHHMHPVCNDLQEDYGRGSKLQS
jgi:hypothetical protein